MKFSFTLTSETGWDAVLQDIREAKESIEVELFIVDVDDVGLTLINALREKARQGVKVKLLVDAGGSYVLYLSPLEKEIQKDGVEISFFNHFLPWYPKRLRLLYFRDHRRSIIIDEKIVYTGGLCFSNNMSGWRDTLIRVEDDASVGDMRMSFKRMWSLTEHHRFTKRHRPSEKDFYYLTNAPVPGRNYLTKKFISLIKASKKEILLTTPYFVPHHPLFKALKQALRRGVSVSLIIPHQSNHSLTDRAGDFQKEALLKAGLKIYMYKERVIHAKTAVFDGEIGFVGSMNLDNISLSYNFEGGLIIKNPECVWELRSHFMNDTQDIPITTYADWQKRPLKQKILSYIMWPFQKLL